MKPKMRRPAVMVSLVSVLTLPLAMWTGYWFGAHPVSGGLLVMFATTAMLMYSVWSGCIACYFSGRVSVYEEDEDRDKRQEESARLREEAVKRVEEAAKRVKESEQRYLDAKKQAEEQAKTMTDEIVRIMTARKYDA